MQKRSFLVAIGLFLVVASLQSAVASANGSNIENSPPPCLTVIAGIHSGQSPTDEFCNADRKGKSRVETVYIVNREFSHFPSLGNDSNRADVEFVTGDQITYLRISLPNGNVIVKEVGKR